MSSVERNAGIALLASGAMVLPFGLMNLTGVLMCASMAAGTSATASGEDLAAGLFLWSFLSLFYVAYVVIGIGGGVLQIVAGTRLLWGYRDGITVAGALAALCATFTVYCAPPSMVAFGFALFALIAEPDEEADSASA